MTTTKAENELAIELAAAPRGIAGRDEHLCTNLLRQPASQSITREQVRPEPRQSSSAPRRAVSEPGASRPHGWGSSERVHGRSREELGMATVRHASETQSVARAWETELRAAEEARRLHKEAIVAELAAERQPPMHNSRRHRLRPQSAVRSGVKKRRQRHARRGWLKMLAAPSPVWL